MKKLWLLSFLFAAVALTAAAQSADYGLWTGAEVDWKLSKRVTLNSAVESRLEQKLKKDTRWSFSVGADWKIVPKFLKAGIGLMYINSYNPQEVKVNYNNSGVMKGYNIDEGFNRDRFRAYTDLTAKYGVGRFTFSLRERYQYTHNFATSTTRHRYRNVVSDPDNYKPAPGELPPYFDGTTYYAHSGDATNDKEHGNKHCLRQRFAVSYNIKGVPLEPYVSFEITHNLSKAFSIEKRRWRIGTDYDIDKQNSLTFGYVYNNSSDDDEVGDLHALEVGYTFKF